MVLAETITEQHTSVEETAVVLEKRGVMTLDELRGKYKEKSEEPKKSKQTDKINPMDWGFPGHLTEEEIKVFVKFRDVVDQRGGEFRNTVYSFTSTEGEAYTLTRWLRARKYVYEDVIKMVEKATECRAEARDQDYYPDPVAALGINPCIYIDQYPQLYTGFAKSGCPIFISKPGVLNIDAIECVTSLEGILNFHWHVMQHDYLKRLLAHKNDNPDFVRFETITILDLDHLHASQLNSRTLGIIKKQTAIDSLCFPETMNKMIIVNAPRFFSFTWTLIKGWLDPRTASKIEMFSSKFSMKKRLLELVDTNELPEDYGGTAKNTVTTMSMDIPSGMTRMATKLLTLRIHDSHVFEVKKGEEVDIHVYTRGTSGATFGVYDRNKVVIINGIDVIHKGDEGNANEMPTHVKLNPSHISGPLHIKVKAEKISGRKNQNFLLVFNVYPKD